MFSLPSMAQNLRPDGVTTSVHNNEFLTQQSVTRNASGSCDSTCDAMSGSAPAVSAQAAFITRIAACGAGYTGNKTQTRNQLPDGSYTAWVDADTSHCVCATTYQDSTQTCAAPLSGTFVRRTPWVCNANVGSWGTPSTVSSSCFTPCALPSPSSQSQTLSCPSGYAGTYSQQRTASCPGGVGSNSVAAWSGWTTTYNGCYIPSCPGQYVTWQGPFVWGRPDAWCSGYLPSTTPGSYSSVWGPSTAPGPGGTATYYCNAGGSWTLVGNGCETNEPQRSR